MGDRINQKEIQASKVAGRDYYEIQRKPTTMQRLIERYNSEIKDNEDFGEIVEALNHYLIDASKGATRSVSEKLEAGDRSDEIERAEELKEHATMRIMQHTFSESAQKIFALVLGELCENFRYKVKPLIDSGYPRKDIDAAIKDEVLNPAMDLLEDNALDLYHHDLRAMIYFLTGNCHIEWH